MNIKESNEASSSVILNSGTKKRKRNLLETLKDKNCSLQMIATFNTTTLVAPKEVIQCRICLEQQISLDNKLIDPCKCQGSVKYVHEMCYRQWILRRFINSDYQQKKALIKNGIKCQLCSSQIYLNFKPSSKCVSYQKLKQRITKKLYLFLVMLTLKIVIVGLLSYLSNSLISNFNDWNSEQTLFYIIIASIVLLALTLIVLLYYLITHYFIQNTWILISFQAQLKMQQRFTSSFIQVHPESFQEITQ